MRPTTSSTVALLPILLMLAACGGAPEPAAAPSPPTPTNAAATSDTAGSSATDPNAATPTYGEPAASSARPVTGAAPPVEATIEARSGAKLSGTITLRPSDGGVQVVVTLKDAPPGPHGVHLHDKGDCSAPDGKSAGGHLNPDSVDHGLPPGKRHLGDLGNIEVAADGTGQLEIVVAAANLRRGDAHSFLGRAVIVHAKPDDGGQPTGNAGGRVGCGAIAAGE